MVVNAIYTDSVTNNNNSLCNIDPIIALLHYVT